MKLLALIPLFTAMLQALPPPGPESPRVAAGHALFQKNCSACHGSEGKGGRGPDLTTGRWKWGSSDADILRNILTGISGTQMPAFAIPEDDGRAIVAWLRSLRNLGPEERITGDARAGRTLFFGAAGCSRCHMFGGQGGRLGPNLSRIGEEKNAAELRKAITDPNESLREGYQTAEVRTADGTAIRGVIKDEDTFSLQMMDESEKLHMFRKADLKEVTRPQRSLMPAPGLSASDVDNVIAFLKTTEPSEIGPGAWSPSSDLNVSFQRIRNAREEPQNWLTYWGDYQGTHYSRLKSITPANVSSLSSQWSFQFSGTGVENTPIVVDGVMFVTGPLNNAAALDARTGRPIWRYTRQIPRHPRAMYRHDQPRFRDSGRPAIHGDAGRASGRARRQDRQRHLGYRGGRLPPGLLHHARAAGARRQDHCRYYRGRMRACRLRRRVRCRAQARDYGERTPRRGKAIRRGQPGRRNPRRTSAAAPPG